MEGGKSELLLGLREAEGPPPDPPTSPHTAVTEGNCSVQRRRGLGTCWNSGKGAEGLPGHSEKRDLKSALGLRWDQRPRDTMDFREGG